MVGEEESYHALLAIGAHNALGIVNDARAINANHATRAGLAAMQ
jgi:3-hydroxy-3-methylglutaryl CoA synthase